VSRRQARLLHAGAFAVFVYALFINTWMGDDPYITLRTVDNLVHGYGATWNTYERVQAYTHPLWMLLLTAAYAVTREGYRTTLALSAATSLGMVWLVRRWLGGDVPWRWPLYLFLLAGSKAFVDYSSSGLENPLTHLLAAAFFALYLEVSRRDRPQPRDVGLASLIVALVYTNRPDAILVCAPALVHMLWRARPRGRAAARAALGSLPAVGWTAFSLVYYGFPLPNTAYAKLNGGHLHHAFFHPNAIDYFANSLRWDPFTLGFVAAALLAGAGMQFRRLRVEWLASGLGVLLYLAYVMRIGGDYMSGRFFALPFLVVALVFVRDVRGTAWAIAAASAVVAATLVNPRAPLRAVRSQLPWDITATGIRDERANYGNLIAWGDAVRVPTKHPVRDAQPLLIVWGSIGRFGFEAGPSLMMVDDLGLSDPLLARLPAVDLEEKWGRGHLIRPIPEGYLASIETSSNCIRDPSLGAYYDDVVLVTRGPLFSAARFGAIWRLNTGADDHLVAEYAARARQTGL
jgi:arabinofuranosyltransferase